MISVFQIFIDSHTERQLDKDFYPYSNEVKDQYFENSVIRRVYEMNPVFNQGIKYIGVSSWLQNKKTHLTGKEIIDHIQKDIDAGTEKDVYIYSPIQGIQPKLDYSINPPLLSGTICQPDAWMGHKQRGEPYKADLMLNAAKVLPFDLFDGKWQYCYCNYWIAKRHVFDEYCQKVLIPAIDFFERPEVKKAMPKWYVHSYTGEKYNSCCFTMEGLFGSFLAHSNYTFDYICKKRINGQGQYKMVRVDGYEIKNN